MLRIILLLVTIVLLGAVSEWQLKDNLAHLDQACASGVCEVCAGAAHQAEPLVVGLHGFERWVSLVLVALTGGMAVVRLSWARELLSMFWGLGFVLLMLSAGAAVAFELFADGIELQWGYRPPFWHSIELSALVDGLGILCAFAALCFGPPYGWAGQDELSLL